MKKKTIDIFKFPQLAVLMVSFAFLTMAAVVFTPAYPELSKQFHLSNADAQWMMTIFLLGTSFGRLPYGPLANRFGRKKTLFLGLFICLLGTVFTLFAETYFFICFGRLIQALGCSVTLKISYTMIGDLHAGAKATKALALSMLVYAILPGIGTAISGFLEPHFGWRGGFWFFLGFAVLFTISCLCLPETLKKKDPDALKIKKIISGYAEQFKNLELIFWSCLMALSTAIIFVFSQEAPFIAINGMGLSPESYGLFYLVPAIGIAGGSLFTMWLADRTSALKGAALGIVMILAGSLAMGIFAEAEWKSGWALFLPQTIIQFGDALLYTFASSQGLSSAKDKSNASAILLFNNSLGAVVATYLVGTFAAKTLGVLSLVSIVITAIMFAILCRLRRQ